MPTRENTQVIMEAVHRTEPENEHPFSVSDARDYAYAIYFHEAVNGNFEEHMKSCSVCQNRVAMIQRNDKGLTGEILQQVKIPMRVAQDPKSAGRKASRPKRAA